MPQRRTDAPSRSKTPERVLLGLQALSFALGGRWLMMLLSGAQLAYLAHRAHTGRSSMHAADMISIMPQEKRERIGRLVLCGAMLLLIIVRCVAVSLAQAPRPRLTLCARRLVEDAIKVAMAPLTAAHGAHAHVTHHLPRMRTRGGRP